jgi:hypothetical protein
LLVVVEAEVTELVVEVLEVIAQTLLVNLAVVVRLLNQP